MAGMQKLPLLTFCFRALSLSHDTTQQVHIAISLLPEHPQLSMTPGEGLLLHAADLHEVLFA